MRSVSINCYKFWLFIESDRLSLLEEKLIKGKPVESSRYAAALYEEEKHYCSGSLITQQHILTAASCLEGFYIHNSSFPDFDRYSALVGSMDLIKGGVRYYYEQVEIHKNHTFGKDYYNYNIGLITVVIKTDIFMDRK